MTAPRILLVSAYDAISHRLWSGHCVEMLPQAQWTILQGQPRHFPWALRGRPLQWFLDDKAQRCLQQPYDLIVATSTVDLAALCACNPSIARTPKLLYMHENQFVYPHNERTVTALKQAHRVDACMVQIYAVLAAQHLVFNTEFHRQSMLDGVQAFLSCMPVKMDPKRLLEKIAASKVLGVPIEDACFEGRSAMRRDGPLVIAWNHRWEFDKAPQRFLRALNLLEDRGVDFRLVLLGEAFGRRHEAYSSLLDRHATRVLHSGMVKDRAEYRQVLRRALVLVSTSLHDFQGLSMLEGAASGLWPLAPARLAYPEIYPEPCLYESSLDDPDKEATALCNALVDFDQLRKEGRVNAQAAVDAAASFSRSAMTPRYLELLEGVLGSGF